MDIEEATKLRKSRFDKNFMVAMTVLYKAQLKTFDAVGMQHNNHISQSISIVSADAELLERLR